MAKRKAGRKAPATMVESEPTRTELWTLFIADLTALFTAYNGKLWRVRRANEIAAAANLIANTLALFGFSRR